MQRASGPELIPVYRQLTISHPPGGRLPSLSARPAVTFPAAEHHHPLAGTKLYCLVTEDIGVNNLPTTCWSQLCKSNALPVAPPRHLCKEYCWLWQIRVIIQALKVLDADQSCCTMRQNTTQQPTYMGVTSTRSNYFCLCWVVNLSTVR